MKKWLKFLALVLVASILFRLSNMKDESKGVNENNLQFENISSVEFPPDDPNFESNHPIETQLQVILSSSTDPSNPRSYIESHRKEYDLLLENQNVVPYILQAFKNRDEKGLKGRIMMSICKDIMPYIPVDGSNGEEWYYNLIVWSKEIIAQNNYTYFIVEYPLLQGVFDDQEVVILHDHVLIHSLKYELDFVDEIDEVLAEKLILTAVDFYKNLHLNRIDVVRDLSNEELFMTWDEVENGQEETEVSDRIKIMSTVILRPIPYRIQGPTKVGDQYSVTLLFDGYSEAVVTMSFDSSKARVEDVDFKADSSMRSNPWSSYLKSNLAKIYGYSECKDLSSPTEENDMEKQFVLYTGGVLETVDDLRIMIYTVGKDWSYIHRETYQLDETFLGESFPSNIVEMLQ